MRHLAKRLSLAIMLSTGLSVSAADFKVSELATDLVHPWGMAFLPNGDAIVSERGAGIRILSADGKLSELLDGVPEAAIVGQGGYLGVAVDPNFNTNQKVYLCLSVEGDGGRGTEVHVGKLKDAAITMVEPVFIQSPKIDSAHHFGCRMVFKDAHLYISLGDRGSVKEQAQNTNNHIGSVVRLNLDGSVPSDNPFIEGEAPEIFTYGHRNVQGMVVHPETGDVWTHEHGPKGGDEINIRAKGNNYGGPSMTYGVNYNGSIITDETAMEGMQQPLTYWVPSIAPSGMAFYSGEQFPEWQGDLFVGSLKFRHLHHIKLKGNKVVSQHELLSDRDERIRDVVLGPDGSLYLLTDAPKGKILKLSKN